MKTLIYKDVIEDIKKRMIDFDSKRFVKNIELQHNNIISDKDFKKVEKTDESDKSKPSAIVENVVAVESEKLVKPDESDLFVEKKAETNTDKNKKPEKAVPEKKAASGLFKSISNFFADDPKKVEAARIASEAKKAEAKRKEEAKKEAAIKKIELAKKIALEKKQA